VCGVVVSTLIVCSVAKCKYLLQKLISLFIVIVKPGSMVQNCLTLSVTLHQNKLEFSYMAIFSKIFHRQS